MKVSDDIGERYPVSGFHSGRKRRRWPAAVPGSFIVRQRQRRAPSGYDEDPGEAAASRRHDSGAVDEPAARTALPPGRRASLSVTPPMLQPAAGSGLPRRIDAARSQPAQISLRIL